MKEQMFSGMSEQGYAKMIWVRGELMVITSDSGRGDYWRNIDHERNQNFNEYLSQQADLTKFTDLQLVWEREARTSG